MERENEGLKQRIAALQDENILLKEDASTVPELKRRITQLQEEHNKAKRRITELEEENHKLWEDLGKINAWQDVKEEMAALQEENRKLWDLQEENRRLRDDLGKRHGLHQVLVSTHRNIFYSEDPNRKRLRLYNEPDRSTGVSDSSMAFGECFSVAAQKEDGKDIWFKILHGDHEDKWVLGRDAGTVNCVDMTRYPPLADSGRIRPIEHAGQEFPSRLYTEGFAGPGSVCLISASCDSFWKEVNVEMLFRGIATATVFEQDWGGDDTLTDWVAFFAVNCVQYGQLGTPLRKRLKVTVKPTSRWARYLAGQCLGPDIDDVCDDIGIGQCKECDWLKGMQDKLHIKWEEVEFVTGFTFLRGYCAWTAEDCKRAANERVVWVLDNFFDGVLHAKAQYEWERAYWLWDEAFHGCSFDGPARDTANENALQCSRVGAGLAVPLSLHSAGALPLDWAELAAVDPVPPEALGDRIAAGGAHGLAVLGGTLHAWGNDGSGQCRVPALAFGEEWLAVSAGGDRSLGVTAGGALHAWGSDALQQCSGAPVLPPGERWVAVSAGSFHSVGLTAEGLLHAWGYDDFGQCQTPSLPQGELWATASAGAGHTCGVTDLGVLHAWGRDDFRQCSGKPELAAGERWLAVSAGGNHSLGLTSHGHLRAWGHDGNGRCSGFPALAAGERWVAVSAGHYHSLGLTSAGVVHGWGRNDEGQCDTPGLPPGQRWLAVSAGSNLSLGLTSAGEVRAWCKDSYGLVSNTPQ